MAVGRTIQNKTSCGVFARFDLLLSMSVIAGFRSCWIWAGLEYLILDIWQVLMTFLVEGAILYYVNS